MAIENDGITILPSTNTVPTPTDPVTVEAAVGHPVSTDALTGTAEPVTTEFGDLGTESTGAVPTPGPWRARASFVKVVRAPGKQEPEAATTAETRSARHASDDAASQR